MWTRSLLRIALTIFIILQLLIQFNPAITFADNPEQLLGPADATTGTMYGGYALWNQWPASADGIVTQIRVKCNNTGNVKVALYTDSGSGNPSTLLQAVNTPTAVVSGWNTINITATPVASGTSYWLGVISDVPCVAYQEGGSTPRKYMTASISSFSFTSSPSGLTNGAGYYEGVAAYGAATPTQFLGPADATTGTMYGGYALWNQWHASANGNVTQIRVKCNNTGNVKVALYTDSGSGSPGTLLQAVNTPTAVVSGWNIINITSTPVASGISYWLGVISDVSCVAYQEGGSTPRKYMTASISSFSFTSTPSGLTNGGGYYEGVAAYGAATPTQFLGPADATTGTMYGGYALWNQWSASANGNVTQIRVKCNNTGNVKVALYTDSGSGSPGTLLQAVNTPTAVVSGWNIINITSTPVASGISYWLGVISDVPCVAYQKGGSTPRKYMTASISSFSFTSTPSGLTNGAGYYEGVAAYGAATPTQFLGPADATTGTLGGYALWNRWRASADGNVTQIRVKCNNTGNVKVALYANNSSGNPSTLLQAVNTPTAVVSGWNTINITATPVVSGISYWLGVISDVSCVAYQEGGSTPRKYMAASISSFSFTSTPSGLTNGGGYYDGVAAYGAATPTKLLGPADATTGTLGGYALWNKWPASANGNVTQIRVKCNNTGNVKVALYASSDSGGPSTLLQAVNTPTAVVSGWNIINITSTPVVYGTYYWLGVISDVSCVAYQEGGSTPRKYRAASISSFSFTSTPYGLTNGGGYYDGVGAWSIH